MVWKLKQPKQLAGKPADAVVRTRDQDGLGSDPLGSFDDGFARVTESFSMPGILAAAVRHPKAGAMALDQFEEHERIGHVVLCATGAESLAETEAGRWMDRINDQPRMLQQSRDDGALVRLADNGTVLFKSRPPRRGAGWVPWAAVRAASSASLKGRWILLIPGDAPISMMSP